MPIKCNLRFRTSRQQREDRYAIITSVDDEFGSSLSLQSTTGKGHQTASVRDMDILKRHTNASNPVTGVPLSTGGRQWRLYQVFPDAVTSITQRIGGLWSSARSHIGSALNKIRGRKDKCGEIWTVRISTEYIDASNCQREDRKKDTETDFESKEEAELVVYRWNNQTFHNKDGSRITYKAIIYLKGSRGSGDEATFLPLAASPTTTGNGNAINGVVNPDCSVVEAGENV